MNNREALLEEREAIDAGLAAEDGCFFQYGPLWVWNLPVPNYVRRFRFLSALFEFFLRLFRRGAWQVSEEGVLKPNDFTELILILGDRTRLMRLSQDYVWLFIPNLYCGYDLGIRYSIQSLIQNRHLWLGYDKETGNPLLLSERLLEGGTSFTGSPGSGKTLNGILATIHQVMVGKLGGIVVVDMKGSRNLFSILETMAEDLGYTFKWFTIRVGRPTYAYNPLLQGNQAFVSHQQHGEQIAQGLGLIKGEFYGADHFAVQCRRVLNDVMQRYGSADRPIRALTQLDDVLRNDWSATADPKLKQDSSNLRAKVEVLAHIDQLNVIPGDANSDLHEHAIRFKDVVTKKQIVVFDLPVAVGGQASRDIARGIAINVHSVCQELCDETGKAAPLYFCVDELQEVVNQEYALVLEQGRESGIRAIYAHHSIAQLKDGMDDFTHVGRMPRYRRMFSVDPDSEDARYVEKASGETILPLHQTGYNVMEGENQSGSSSSRSWVDNWSEMVCSRIDQNQMNDVNARRNLSIVRMGEGHGFSHFGSAPFVLYASRYLNTDAFPPRPWPKPRPGTVMVTRHSTYTLGSRSASPSETDNLDGSSLNSRQEKHLKRREKSKARKARESAGITTKDPELQQKLRKFRAKQDFKMPSDGASSSSPNP